MYSNIIKKFFSLPSVAGAIILTVFLIGIQHCNAPQSQSTSASFSFNDNFISALYTQVDLEDPKAVFGYVFRHLRPRVTVFPSENLYYFTFVAYGRTYKGSLSFYVGQRDSSLGFGFVPINEHKSRQKFYPMSGGSHNFTHKDGLNISKIGARDYQVNYAGKTVVFHLYQQTLKPPVKAKIAADEVFIAPTFDESGLKFYLVFNKSINKLIWVLNEDGFVPETFYAHSENVLIGDRTEFAFYDDKPNHRKIMIGVEGENVLQNNWYDGPFDQMPDNLVAEGKVVVKPYLELHYSQYKGRIDDFGRYLHSDSSRIAVAPYMVYFDRAELDYVDELVAGNTAPEELLRRITKQRFTVPAGYYPQPKPAE